jgi:hypothetical protein
MPKEKKRKKKVCGGSARHHDLMGDRNISLDLKVRRPCSLVLLVNICLRSGKEVRSEESEGLGSASCHEQWKEV